VERDDLVQVAERALFDAEQAYRADPSELNQRRVQRAWAEVREARGEPLNQDVPLPFLPSPSRRTTDPPVRRLVWRSLLVGASWSLGRSVCDEIAAPGSLLATV